MRKPRLWMAACAAICLPALAVSGCGSSSDSSTASSSTAAASGDKPVTVGVATPSGQNPFWVALADAATAQAAKMKDVNVVVSTTQQGDVADTAQMTANVENLMAKNVNAIVVVGYGTGLGPVLDRANAQGIKIVFVNSNEDDFDKQVSYVRTDNVQGGKLAGDLLVKLLPHGGKIGLLQCALGVPSCQQRISGGQDALKAAGIATTKALPTDCARDKAVSAAQDLITANPDLDGIYAVCDEAALGALQAAKAAGKDPSKFFVVGFDGTQEGLQSVADGGLRADVAQFPKKMGSLGLEQAVKALRGEPTEKDIDSGVAVVDPENVEQFLADNGNS